MKKGILISIVVGILVAITANLEVYTESLGSEIRIVLLQKSVLLQTTRIIRKSAALLSTQKSIL